MRFDEDAYLACQMALQAEQARRYLKELLDEDEPDPHRVGRLEGVITMLDGSAQYLIGGSAVDSKPDSGVDAVVLGMDAYRLRKGEPNTGGVA